MDFLSGIALRARRGMLVASGPAVSRRTAQNVGARGGRTPIRSTPEPRHRRGFGRQSVPQDHPEPKVADSQMVDRRSSNPVVEPKVVDPEVVDPEAVLAWIIAEPKMCIRKACTPTSRRPGPRRKLPSPGLQPGNAPPSSPDTAALIQMICRVRMPEPVYRVPGHAIGASVHRRALPVADGGSAGPVRRSRSDA